MQDARAAELHPVTSPPCLDAARDAGESEVVAVIDGDTVRLMDGREVRLVGTQAPKLPLGRDGYPTWPLAHEARAALMDMVLRETVKLRVGGLEIDRHGRTLAHLVVASGANAGQWVQGTMIGSGLARVYTFSDNRACAPELIALELDARGERRGIWANRFYRIRLPNELEGLTDSFQIVEGIVRSAALTRDRLYVNFGEDWRTDFTVAVDERDVETLGPAFADPKALAGRRLRVRGWLTEHNGPEIEATHPEQFEFVE